ncbi:hypothetical protein C7212DRAFT_283294 [Tuber magnatum]|uniref:ARB-07466-like C-terminal domain-containing protein n=1 Tax=Tuber magnatum TaxID=42249 RepID=A0A317SIL3_9PEZI|nr:hypothetical protein C7212DRAFT_283294 [Tuber magnatum]
MKFLAIASLLLLSATAHAAVNDRCSTSGTPGVCISTANCASGGGKSTAGFCPNDPDDIRCCTKTTCDGGDGIPTIPTNKCQSHVVTNGYIILNQFPHKIHTVWCYANKPGDHGTGTALDLMVGNRNPIGQTIAEWTMENHGRLKVKYIIWGQRIWNVEVEGTPRPWAQWRRMDDRGDDTANHWYV